MRNFFIPFVVVLLLQACMMSHNSNTVTTEEINRMEIALRRLGAAVQGLLWSATPQDADLIAMACKNDPSLCGAFGNNKLYTRVVDGNAVLLLCTQDDKRALVEDIACTPTPDKKFTGGNAPCEFTLPDQTIRDVCR
jgi:hypothetical protein